MHVTCQENTADETQDIKQSQLLEHEIHRIVARPID